MASDSGGGGSNVHKRANPQIRRGASFGGTRGQSGVTQPKSKSKADVAAAQRDNRRKFGEDVYDPEGKRKRVEAQVKKADEAAKKNREAAKKKPAAAKKPASKPAARRK